MYTRILVPLDGSERALAALGPARRLARLHGAELGVVTVAGPASTVEELDVIVEAGRQVAGEPIGPGIVLRGADAASALGDQPLARADAGPVPSGRSGGACAPTEQQIDELGYVRRVALRLEREGHRVTDVTVQHPSTPDALVDFASGVPHAFLAVSTADVGPVTETLEGSIAAQVVRSSSVPVLIARHASA